MEKILTLIKDKKIRNSNTEYEICVGCGKITDVLSSTPIDLRDNYIVGAGQLCRACYSELYNKTCTKKEK